MVVVNNSLIGVAGSDFNIRLKHSMLTSYAFIYVGGGSFLIVPQGYSKLSASSDSIPQIGHLFT